MQKVLVILLVLFAVFELTACSTVKPWERGILARPELAWEHDSLRGQLAEHVYFSKEGSSGGYGAGGGGCGCN